MSDNIELFRNDLAAKLAMILPPDKLHDALQALDQTVSGYDVSKKETSLSVIGEIPEVVKIFLASKAVENLGIKTLEQYRYKLINFFSHIRKPFSDITANDIRLYLYDYKSSHQISDSTVDGTRRILNSFFSWLVLNDYLLRNPVAKIPKIKHQQKERVPLTSYELEVIRWHCKTIREKALIDFLFSTGCRVSECVSVELSDIGWNARSVKIRHGKGDKARTVFFNAEAEVSLKKYLETRNDSTPSLFVSDRKPHGKLTPRAVELIVKKIQMRAQIQTACTPHVLRHTFATTGIRSGIPLEQLQALMGHSKPETTLIYAKLDQSDLQKAHQQIYA